ncbi:class I SAM-dependent methyltransferase [Cytophagales bacterium LB-30]|uniref:Class I SAM-dependent methyltransferase n=1 Tax=Shiella aurantiaca TaxID=3058365 RepID=A0ABT8F3G4_9BACT|nr:class I SAM-dependent methyltransferase [Shiella aurantiaca]MDN4164756.1 class I SAM-dependent methyltransferase [Shiella aurantiaca]
MEQVDIKYLTNRRVPFYQVASKYIKDGDCVLDIGCGLGDFADLINKENIILFDGNPETVEYLTKKGYPKVILGILPEIPVADSSVNIVHCSHIFEHLEPTLLYDSLKEIDRILAEKGYLIISTPLLWSKFYDDLSHVKPYSSYVFKKYMVFGIKGSTTRSIISNRYKVIEEVERFSLQEENSNYVITRMNVFTFAIKHIFRLQRLLLSKIGLKRVEKSGYTLVLQKG